MKHQHHIKPKHRGGTDDEWNLTPPIEPARCEDGWSSHAIFHFCEWQLWGLRDDFLAWKGLAGFLGKEEIIEQLMEEGRKKARIANALTNQRLLDEGKHNFQDQAIRHKALENSLKAQAELASDGKHSLQNPEMRARKARADRKKQLDLWEKEENPLQRSEVVQKRKESSSASRSAQNSEQVTCPHCGKTGGKTNMKRYHFDKCKLNELLELAINRPSH
jgi:hypothetical protein